MSASASQARRPAPSLLAAWPSLFITLLVAAAAVYSFSPRPLPPFPATQIQPHQLLVNGLAQQGQRVLAAGEQGRILYTDDVTKPWNEAQIQPQRGSTFTQIAFIGPKTAIAVGHDGWIVRSEDGGANWKEAHFDAEQATPLMGVAGPYAGRLLAFGAFGLMLRSDDDGRSWVAQSHAAIGDHHVNAMTQAGDGALLAAGERGLLVRSTDGGQSWQSLPQVYTGSFYGLLALPDHRLVVYGMRGNAFYSADGGKTWIKSAVPEGDLALFGGTLDAQGAVILVGEAETVLRSIDGGAHFTQVAQGERKRLTAALPLADGGLLIAGESGVARKSAAAAQESAK